MACLNLKQRLGKEGQQYSRGNAGIIKAKEIRNKAGESSNSGWSAGGNIGGVLALYEA